MFKLDQLKDGVRRALPILSAIARVTPSKADDALVALLGALLASDDAEGFATAVGSLIEDGK